MPTFWTVDLGATSGRVMSVQLSGDRVSMQEEIRFVNEPLHPGVDLLWDVEGLWQQTLIGLESAAARAQNNGNQPSGIAVDSWGVDFALVDEAGRIGPARHYRSASPEVAARIQDRVGARELFGRSGVAPMGINTVFRLADALAEYESPSGSVTMLLIADLWTYRLTATRGAELTMAGTTAMLDITTGRWDLDLLTQLGIDATVLPEIVHPGTPAGSLLPDVAARVGANVDVAVMRTASHDTAAAVAAIPASGNVAFISCGTWALVGVETTQPVLSEAAFTGGFTNEVGANGRVLFMRNLTGLWLLERCLEAWRLSEPTLSLDGLLAQAALRIEFTSVVDVGASSLVHSPDIEAEIRRLCAATAQNVPTTPAEMVRCILLSLAVAFRQTLIACQQHTGTLFEQVHMVGGGTRNVLLCQLIADTCGLEVVVGPAEATTLGNALVQAFGLGMLESGDHIRHIVRNSYHPVRYRPGTPTARDAAPASFPAQKAASLDIKSRSGARHAL